MGYVEEIFERANLNSICEYLEYGTEPLHKKASGKFEERLHNAGKLFRKEMFLRFPDINEEDIIFKKLSNLSTEQEEVYMEIGILVGIQLANELKHLSETIK